MPTCRGNRGNLLQHWVLCELLQVANKEFSEDSHLLYIDAYPMAPFAPMREQTDQTRGHFLHVRNRMPEERSTYETCWHKLTHQNRDVYPSSLVFVDHLWKRRLSVCLSESDPLTHEEIVTWLNSPEQMNRFETKQVYLGDWRDHLTSCWLETEPDWVFVSFDPNMYDQHDLPEEDRKPENMYQPDLRTVASLCETWECPVVVQLSTYSAHDNPQKFVEAQINEEMTTRGRFSEPVVFRADGRKMSLVYFRGADLFSQMAAVVSVFELWLENSKPGIA